MVAFKKKSFWLRQCELVLAAVFALLTVRCLAFPAGAVEQGSKGLEEYFIVKQHEPYVSGYEDHTFRPSRGITRGEAAKMLYSLLREPPKVAASPFSDIPAGKWYSEAVVALAQLGVFHGYEDGTFRPNAPITRAELVTALTAFVPKAGTKSPFSDVPESSWACQSIVTASSLGWISGYPNGTFQPKKTISRAEAVLVVNRALERTGTGFAENRTGNYFTDLTEDHWAYSHIVEASGAVARPPVPPGPGKKQLQITASSLNVRSGPGTGYSVLVVLGKNTLLNLIEKTDPTWLHVSTLDGVEGYVHKDYVAEYTPVTIPAKAIQLSASSAELAQYQSFRLDGLSTPRTSLKWSSSNTAVVSVSTLRYKEGDESCFLYGKSPGTATVYCSDYGGNTLAKCSVTVLPPEPVRFAFTEPNLVTTKTAAKLVAITDKQKTSVLFTVEDSLGNCVLSQEVSEYLPEQYEHNETHVFQCGLDPLAAGEYHVKVCSEAGKGEEGCLRFNFTVHGPEAPDVTTNTSRDISDTMVGIMMEYESYLPVIRDDAAAPKNPTVGYGMVINTNKTFYNFMTTREAKALLIQQINKNFGRYVNQFREKYGLHMSQSQYDALVSFSYNLGPGYINDPAGNSLFTTVLNAVVPPGGLSAANPCAAVLNVKSAGLYEAPAGNGKAKRQVPKGATLQVTGIQRNAQNKELWYQVKIGADTGWMRGGNIRLTAPSAVHDLNYVDSMTFASYLLAYHHTDTTCLPALLYRRLAEAKLFNHANYEQASSKHPLFTKNTYHYQYPDCMKRYE